MISLSFLLALSDIQSCVGRVYFKTTIPGAKYLHLIYTLLTIYN